MKQLYLVTLLFLHLGLYVQTTYLHCSKLIDCTDKSVREEMTIIVKEGVVYKENSKIIGQKK
ncbi:MAG: hypothetical protein AAF806_26655 [Bacteroidota bacterium]